MQAVIANLRAMLPDTDINGTPWTKPRIHQVGNR